MTYEKFPDQAGQNFPVAPQYATHPGTAVNAFESPQYETFPSGVAAPVTPLTIMGANTVAWWRADVVVEGGGTVSQWTDQTSNGWHLTEATNQPAYNAAGGPNGTPSILGDGVNDQLSNLTLDLPDPDITPIFYWAIARSVGWTNTDRFWGSGTGTANTTLLQSGVSPQILASNGIGTPVNGGLAVGTWGRIEVYHSNTTNDYLKAIATTVTGIATGGGNPAATFRVFAAGNGTSFGNVEFAELAIFDVLPDAGQLAALDAYCTARYGAGLV